MRGEARGHHRSLDLISPRFKRRARRLDLRSEWKSQPGPKFDYKLAWLKRLGQNAPRNWCGGYGSPDGVLDAGFFRGRAETLRLYRVIATMDASAPLPSLPDQAPTWALRAVGS